MRLAVGVDIVAVPRFSRLLRENDQAAETLFTDRERQYCATRRHPHVHLAARFAAKEAVLKALGTGLGTGMRWTDVEVVNNQLGQPTIRLSGRPLSVANARGPVEAAVSLSHTGDYAIAHAVLSWGGRPCASS